MARSSRSSGVSTVSPLGVTLPTRMSPGLTSAPMRMMPLSSRSFSASSPTLGMSRVISSLPSLVSRASISNSSMWIEVYRSSFTSRSLMRMASSKLYPPQGMKATRTFWPSASSPCWVAGPSAITWPLHHPIPLGDDRLLVDAGVLVAAPELHQGVDVDSRAVVLPVGAGLLRVGAHEDAVGRHRLHHPAALGHHHRARILGGHELHAGPHQRGVGPEQGDRLALHVGAHQGAVGVVVLQEGDQGGGDAHQLLGGDVHVLDLVRRTP